uniref:Uncharacterized protein n=1 Tax=Ciona intestinalis TaxID=7719 RepID=H2XYH6_CIOIN
MGKSVFYLTQGRYHQSLKTIIPIKRLTNTLFRQSIKQLHHWSTALNVKMITTNLRHISAKELGHKCICYI